MGKRILRETEWKTCGECGSRSVVKQESFGCEHCGKVLDMARRHAGYLETTVFRNDHEAEHYYVCSVACFMKWFKGFALPADFNFISFPLTSGRTKVNEFRAWLKARP